MDKETVLDVLDKAGHGQHRDELAALVQTSYWIVAERLAGRPADFRQSEDSDGIEPERLDAFEQAMAALPLGASRFGGVPDLPPGATWPERDGVPMEFIAQLRLTDLSDVRAGDDRLPGRGSLLFFYNAQWATTDQGEAGCCAVLFHDGPDEALVRATPGRVEWKSEFSNVSQFAPFLHGVASLRFERTVSVPGGVGPYVQGPLKEVWQDMHCEHHGAMTGHEAFHENYLLGYVDEQDYVDAHVNGTEDQLLLQVDSEDAADFGFGDCNKLFFLLTKAELAARDFANVRIYSMLG